MTSTEGLDHPAVGRFSRTLSDHGLSLRRKRTEILQLNVCKLCNLTCIHCHVNAGPKRKEIINRDTLDRILASMLGPAARREGERDLRPLTATCTALTTDSVGAGRSRSVTFRSKRSTPVATGDRSSFRIIMTTGRSDQDGCLSTFVRSSSIPSPVMASSVKSTAPAPT